MVIIKARVSTVNTFIYPCTGGPNQFNKKIKVQNIRKKKKNEIYKIITRTNEFCEVTRYKLI